MGNTNSPEHVIAIEDLTRRFGAKTALNQVTLQVPRGTVFGLVGENGAGKTTLIKHILGLLKAQKGSVRVFGMDPVHRPAEVLGRIGYLSEDRDLPEWMRVSELLRYTAAFYPKWDAKFAESLREQFALDPAARLRTLSRGESAKAGLMVALAHRPDLLLLDEPSSGLDPVVRRDILGAIIRTVADEGRTVLFSSHLLEEVQRVADRVAMISHGRIVLDAPLDDVLAKHMVLTVRFEKPCAKAPVLPGALVCDGSGCEWTIVSNGSRPELEQALTAAGGRVVEERHPSLEEVFIARAGVNPAELTDLRKD